MTHDPAFEQWASLVWRLGSTPGQTQSKEIILQNFRKNLTIEIYNEAGQPVLRYFVYRCWVSEYQARPGLDANANAVAIQTIKLENEGWERDTTLNEPAQPTDTA